MQPGTGTGDQEPDHGHILNMGQFKKNYLPPGPGPGLSRSPRSPGLPVSLIPAEVYKPSYLIYKRFLRYFLYFVRFILCDLHFYMMQNRKHSFFLFFLSFFLSFSLSFFSSFIFPSFSHLEIL